jgi:hypothetical protein
MNYNTISSAAQQLTYREKLKLAHLLIELALKEDEQNLNQPVAEALGQTVGHIPRKAIAETQAKVIDPNRPWIGRDYEQLRIFVLGESYTGTFESDLEYDDSYMAALLDGKVVEGTDLFNKMAEKLGLSLSSLWHKVAFTNMALGSIGATNETKVTAAQLKAGRPRLETLLRHHKPKGVLILGAKTGEAAAPVCQRLGIAHRTVYHPSGINNANPRTACTAEMLQTAWRDLENLEQR